MDSTSSLTTQENTDKENGTVAFSFGGVDTASPFDMLNCVDDAGGIFYDEMNEYWVPPLDREMLLKLSKTNPQHGPILFSRRNMACEQIILSPLLKRAELEALVFNYLTFGDGALLKIRDRLKRVIEYVSLSSLWLRRDKKGNFKYLQRSGEPKTYKATDIIFMSQYDPYQQIYGVPDYIGGLQSSMLNNDATLFRRKYYKNGAHCGFIFYATDPNLDVDKEKELENSMKQSKGVGNFSSLFVNIPNGKPDGIKIIPVGDIATKDDFSTIKSVTAQDMLNAHRFPAGLAGIIPSGAANFGDPLKADETYKKNESIPLARAVIELINSDSETPAKYRLKLVDTAA
ncbi:phage portal protein [Photobacterium leiognathi]|uniref:phage portal protein n=1 Tax=Photobacterium leiognathi TaxID=553611 RepID=UPI0029824C27|nr:phage portal protein [Photobacterium leiognathi]